MKRPLRPMVERRVSEVGEDMETCVEVDCNFFFVVKVDGRNIAGSLSIKKIYLLIIPQIRIITSLQLDFIATKKPFFFPTSTCILTFYYLKCIASL